MCGLDLREFEYVPLIYHQSAMIKLLQKTKIPYKSYVLKTLMDYKIILENLKQEIFENILIVYTGHGSGRNDEEYPLIYPVDKSFNLYLTYDLKNKNKKKIKIQFLFDCCNRGTYSLGNESTKIVVEKEDYTEEVQKFLNLNFDYLCLKKGLLNYGTKEYTVFNSLIMDVILNFEYEDLNEFIDILNYNTLNFYKQKTNALQNKRIRVIINCGFKTKIKLNNTNKPIKLNNFKINIQKEELESIKIKGQNLNSLDTATELSEYIQLNILQDEELEEEEE